MIKIPYKQAGDYLIPDLTLPCQSEKPLGKYGRMRLNYLKKHHKGLYTVMWQVNCFYVKSASGSLRDVSSYADDERNSLDYHQLLIDAQTGEMVVLGDKKDRYEFKGFTSWDEIQ